MTNSHKRKRVETREWRRFRAYLAEMRGLLDAADFLKDDPAALADVNQRMYDIIGRAPDGCPPRFEDER